MVDDEHLDARVAVVAERQLGLVTTGQLAELGVTPRQVRARRDSGRWTSVHPGVLRIAGHPVDASQSLLAACTYTGGIASHASVAWVWGLSGFASPPSVPHVSVMGDTGRRRPGIRVHRVGKLHHEDRTRRRAIPVTTVARTLIDLGSCARPGVVELARDDARRRGLLDLVVEDDRIGALSARGRRGPNVLRAVRTLDGDHVPPDSELERKVIRALARHGIPDPVRQFRVLLPGGRAAVLDLAWPDCRVALEVVGWRYHGTFTKWAADLTRERDVTSLRWHVLSATALDLRDGGLTLARTVRRALATATPTPTSG